MARSTELHPWHGNTVIMDKFSNTSVGSLVGTLKEEFVRNQCQPADAIRTFVLQMCHTLIQGFHLLPYRLPFGLPGPAP